jgi:hypothetical protein
MRACAVNQAIGFDELRWLQELGSRTRKKAVPELIGARLLTRRLIERAPGGFALTARGRIALAKLG